MCDDSKEGNSASFGLKMAVAREGRDETRGFPIARSGGCRPGNPRTRTRASSLRTVSVRAVAVGARATRAGEASVRTRVTRCSGDLRDWCRLPLSRCAPGRADTRRDLTRATRATRVARPRPRSFLTYFSPLARTTRPWRGRRRGVVAVTRIATRDASRGVFRRCRRVNTQRGRSPAAPAGPRAPPVGRCRLGPRGSADPSDLFFHPARFPTRSSCSTRRVSPSRNSSRRTT